MKPERCKVMLFRGLREHQCSRKHVRDGYCAQHHPDAVASRRKKTQAAFEEKRKRGPWYRLQAAQARIAELEAENAQLRKRVAENRPDTAPIPPDQITHWVRKAVSQYDGQLTISSMGLGYVARLRWTFPGGTSGETQGDGQTIDEAVSQLDKMVFGYLP